jgi:hypothetical protein
MRRSASNALRQHRRPTGSGPFRLGLSKRVLPVGRKPTSLVDVGEFVVLQEVPGTELGSAFEGDHVEAGSRARLDPDTARRTGSDYTDIDHPERLAPSSPEAEMGGARPAQSRVDNPMNL